MHTIWNEYQHSPSVITCQSMSGEACVKFSYKFNGAGQHETFFKILIFLSLIFIKFKNSFTIHFQWKILHISAQKSTLSMKVQSAVAATHKIRMVMISKFVYVNQILAAFHVIIHQIFI